MTQFIPALASALALSSAPAQPAPQSVVSPAAPQPIAGCWYEYRNGKAYWVCGNPCVVHNCGTRIMNFAPVAIAPTLLLAMPSDHAPHRGSGRRIGGGSAAIALAPVQSGTFVPPGAGAPTEGVKSGSTH